MPQFLDYHARLPLIAPDVVEAMLERIRSGSLGNSEVTRWNIYVGGETGQAWCLSEAPDSEAVFQAHRLVGFPQSEENVVEINQLV